MHQIRDPVHGFIDISLPELKIIDTAPFQRLRHIKQLASTYLVYPGAEHTRFGHSLGVMHLVSKAYDSALANYKASHGENLFGETKEKWHRQILRLIALTHDLGHAPFSHATESLFDGGTEHEDFTKEIIFKTEIAVLIKEIGVKFRKDHPDGDKLDIISPELLWLIYGEKNPELDPSYIMPEFKFLKSFMDGELDCDKMDYLLRDSHYCGVDYGKYDLSRLLSSLCVYKNEDDNILQLSINHSGIHALEQFVLARYFMFTQVYFHKTRRFLDKLLAESISDVLPDGKYPTDVAEYLKWDDQLVIGKLRENQEKSEAGRRFLNRQVMSCIHESKTHGDDSDKLIHNIGLKELKKELKCEIFGDTADKLAHKIPSSKLGDIENGIGIPVMVPNNDKPENVLDKSILLKSLLDKSINIKRLYTEKEFSQTAKELMKDLIRACSH